MKTKKIMIGSAQFGMHYGIANQNGQVHGQEIEKILSLAKSMQINQIDTASAYGESEAILGQYANEEFDVVTKLLPLNEEMDDINRYVKIQYLHSLARLRRETCEGLLVHHAENLLGPKGEWVYEALSELKIAGFVKKIGSSVYSPEQVYALIDRFKLDIIQFPLNILDQRFLQHQLLLKLKQSGIELHARSIFLQGLLLMQYEKIPNHFNKIKPLLLVMQKECESKGLTMRQALIEFIISIKEIDHCIFGIDNHQQLNEIINDVLQVMDESRIQFNDYACDDLDIINPTNWKLA